MKRFSILVLTVFLTAASTMWAADAPPVPASKPLDLTDKTLVAWVRLADTAQRAGSALTLIDPEEHFDAIVYAEVAPLRWMAGSDFFRRTSLRDDQDAWPAEDAAPGKLIQLAIAYQGKNLSLYRDGKPYAAYTIDTPQTFGRDASVLLGLRYVGSGGEIGFLKGSIEEARIYDRALDAKTIASLAPNKPSDPKPIAQWTFEDGTLADSMKTFPPGELRGGARIEGGQLHLDGQAAYAIISQPPGPAVPQAMFFQGRRLGGQWDTWLYWHEGIYYLYILAGPGGKWNGIGMARSNDGAHWEDLGMVLRKAEGVTWLGTGSTWKSPNFAADKKFQLNFSEWRGDRQTIFFAESTDLVHWTRLGDEYEFKQDDRWYKPKGRWDCIYTIAKPSGGGLFGYWTADPKTGPGVGFGQSADGVRWEALPPPKFEGGAPHGECGAIEKIGDSPRGAGKYYMMLGAGGMVTLVADRPEGPFRPAAKNFRLLSGHTYFSRFFPTPSGLLVNHHSMAGGGVYFAPLKHAVLDEEGTLRLKWWAGNEKLKHQAISIQAPPAGPDAITMLTQDLPIRDGVVIEGVMTLPAPRGDPAAAQAKPVGLYIEHGSDAGTAIRVGQNGVTEIGLIKADGSGFASKDRMDRQIKTAATANFRLLLKHSLLEFYLDDHLIQCWSLPQRPTGRVGLIYGQGAESIKDVRAWQ